MLNGSARGVIGVVGALAGRAEERAGGKAVGSHLEAYSRCKHTYLDLATYRGRVRRVDVMQLTPAASLSCDCQRGIASRAIIVTIAII